METSSLLTALYDPHESLILARYT